MNGITIKTQTNGYEAVGLQKMIEAFDKAAAALFQGCTVKHFYYGDYLDMADIITESGDEYGRFNILANRVSFNGHSGSMETIRKFRSMTYNDELFRGKLMELARNAE